MRVAALDPRSRSCDLAKAPVRPRVRLSDLDRAGLPTPGPSESVIPESYVVDMESEVTIDALEQELVACERIIGRLRAHQLGLMVRLDAAQVPQMDGSRSMLEWVAARCDTSHDTARMLTQAMRQFAEQEEISAGLTRGDVSFDRALATARLANSGADRELVEASRRFDIDGIGRLAARHRHVSRRTEHDIAAARHVALQPNLDRSSGRLWGELPGFEYSTIEKALFQRSDELPTQLGTESRGARLADALVSIAQDSLDREAPESGRAPAVTVFVDADLAAPSGGETGAEISGNGLRVGPGTLERILCSGTVDVVGVGDGRPVVATDRSRAIPPAIRRFVLWRDGGCTIDGCRSRYRLEPHHVLPRADGGSHEPENLTTLCWHHHHVVVHLRGYTLDPASPPQRRRLLRPLANGPP